MDNAPDAPADSTLDEQRPRDTVEQQLASFNPDSPEAPIAGLLIGRTYRDIGEIKPAIQSVTDAAHFNRTPKMQFVDVVDADASNRASLLFELRSQNARQFALYRVIASHPEQIFLTGTTQ